MKTTKILISQEPKKRSKWRKQYCHRFLEAFFWWNEKKVETNVKFRGISIFPSVFQHDFNFNFKIIIDTQTYIDIFYKHIFNIHLHWVSKKSKLKKR